MHKILNDKIYLDFLDTLQFSSSKVLELPDENLEDFILEDLDAAYRSLFRDSTLSYLLTINLIDDLIYQQSLRLRNKIESVIDDDDKRCAKSFRNDLAWKEVFSLTDEILDKLSIFNNE